MNEQRACRVELVGLNNKRQIIAIFCGSLVGAFLSIQLICKGKTNRYHPRFGFLLEWDIIHAAKHWSNGKTMIQYVHNIIVPFVEQIRESLCEDEDKAAIVIIDNFKGQVTPAMTELLERHHIHSCYISPNTTDRLQLMDVAVNTPAKSFLKEQFQNWYFEEATWQLARR